MKRLAGVAASVAVLALTLGVASSPAGASDCGRACRVLVITLPAVSWDDLRSQPLPHLTELLSRSAIASLSTRTAGATTPASGYTSLGAGARTVADRSVAGMNLQSGERFGDGTAGDAYTRRIGASLRPGTIVALGFAPIMRDNENQLYDAVPGALGQALQEAGIRRGVVANADQDEIQPREAQLHREAVLSLVDESGRAPGEATTQLLRDDPEVAFGQRLASRNVEEAFAKRWDGVGRAVVVVEASDAARADAYRTYATAEQRGVLRTRALRYTDALVGRLLTHVDPRRDAVLVVGPYPSTAAHSLTVAAVRAPGIEAGRLVSSTTRRAGFVAIVDVAPTVLDLLGVERPDSMEGRPMEVTGGAGSYQDRVARFVRNNNAALFRDSMIGKITVILVVLVLVLSAGVLIWLRRPALPLRASLGFGALMLLGFLAATFLAAPFPFAHWGNAAYGAFLAGVAVLWALVATTLGRRDPRDPLIIGLGGLVTLHMLDALSGARLELSTVFGYSPTVGIRFAGLGNPASAQLCAGALLFATLLATRFATPRGTRIAIAVLAVTLLIVAAPIWGQDFGGAISAVPAFGYLGARLLKRRVTIRGVVLLGAALVVVGLLVGLVDLARPSNQRTHVGRFFEKVGTDGASGFTEVIERKAQLMLDSFGNTGWVVLVLLLLGALAYAARTTDLSTRVVAAAPTMRDGAPAFALLAVLTTLLNDSGVQIAGMMLAVFVPVIVFLATRTTDASATSAAGDGQARWSVSQPRI